MMDVALTAMLVADAFVGPRPSPALDQASQAVELIAKQPDIADQGCSAVFDAHIPISRDVLVGFTGTTSKTYHQVSATQFSKLRDTRDPVIEILSAWLDRSALGSTDDDSESVRNKLTILIDLNATRSLPGLKRFAERLMTEISGPHTQIGPDRASTGTMPVPWRTPSSPERANAEEQLGDVLSTIATILRQERFEPLLKSSMEKDAEASVAEWKKGEWSRLLQMKITSGGGEIPPEYRDVVFVDPVLRQPVTLWAFEAKKVYDGTVWAILRWVDDYGKLPADKKLDAKGMLAWPVNR